jgi:hypothetical protein
MSNLSERQETGEGFILSGVKTLTVIDQRISLGSGSPSTCEFEFERLINGYKSSVLGKGALPEGQTLSLRSTSNRKDPTAH